MGRLADVGRATFITQRALAGWPILGRSPAADTRGTRVRSAERIRSRWQLTQAFGQGASSSTYRGEGVSGHGERKLLLVIPTVQPSARPVVGALPSRVATRWWSWRCRGELAVQLPGEHLPAPDRSRSPCLDRLRHRSPSQSNSPSRSNRSSPPQFGRAGHDPHPTGHHENWNMEDGVPSHRRRSAMKTDPTTCVRTIAAPDRPIDTDTRARQHEISPRHLVWHDAAGRAAVRICNHNRGAPDHSIGNRLLSSNQGTAASRMFAGLFSSVLGFLVSPCRKSPEQHLDLGQIVCWIASVRQRLLVGRYCCLRVRAHELGDNLLKARVLPCVPDRTVPGDEPGQSAGAQPRPSSG